MASTKPTQAGKQDKLFQFKEDVEDFLTQTEDARHLSERDRDYKDNIQWTADEIATLNKRNQAPIVVNRIRPKIEGLKGLLIQRQTDPKAYPRTPKHEKAAEVVTDGLRYVSDNVDFDQVKLDVAENVFVEGYGAAIIEYIDDEITCTRIPWDRYYYDVYSRRLDFKDKRWDGIILWMDIDEVNEQFGVNVLDEETNEPDGQETFDDRPLWIDKKNNRVRICQHFFIEKGVWKMCYFTSVRFLIKPVDSPYLDDKGRPTNPIEAYTANIDRDNNRFGEVRYWIDLQDEINHRRSKFLHLLNSRQTAGRKGAIPDIPAAKRELAKPDGHLEYNGEKGDFEVLSTNDMKEGQFLLYQDGKSEIDAVGFNAQLSGERQGDLSGRAITNLQQASINELSSLYNGLTNWEKRVYRQFWMRIKQFWTEERWIRVLDDQKLRWVGFNQQITLQAYLEEQIQDDSVDLQTKVENQALLQRMLQEQDPELQKIIETRNDVAELDVDIMIEVSLDSINVQQEEFEMIANIAQTRPEVPFKEIIRLSSLRSKTKEQIIGSIEAGEQAFQQQQQAQAQAQAEEAQAKNADKMASAQQKTMDAAKKEQEALQTKVQTAQLIENPPEDSSVIL